MMCTLDTVNGAEYAIRVWYLNCLSACIVLKKHEITGKLRKSIKSLQMLQHIVIFWANRRSFWANRRSHVVLNHSPYYLTQGVLNDLSRARLSRGLMILLLAHPLITLPPPGTPLLRKIDRRHTERLRKRDKLLTGDGDRSRNIRH